MLDGQTLMKGKKLLQEFMQNTIYLIALQLLMEPLLPLMTAPHTEDAPAYHGRKFLYSMSVMIVNDDQKKLGITFRVFQDALMIKEYMRVLPCSKKQNKNLKLRKRQNIF